MDRLPTTERRLSSVKAGRLNSPDWLPGEAEDGEDGEGGARSSASAVWANWMKAGVDCSL